MGFVCTSNVTLLPLICNVLDRQKGTNYIVEVVTVLHLNCISGAEIRSVCTEAGMFAIRSRRKVSVKKVFFFSAS